MKSNWDNLKVGMKASFEVHFDKKMVDEFAGLSGDDNPIHMDAHFATSRGFKGRIVHGMLSASCFSKLVGKHFLADDNLYLSQTLQFKKPILVGERATVSGVIVSISESLRTLDIRVSIVNVRGEEAVTGMAVVKST